MTLPHDASRLAGVTDWATWKAALERALGDLDSRIVSSRGAAARASARTFSAESAPVTSGRAGEAYVWLGQGVPYDAVPADGSWLVAADYPYLYAALGQQYDDTADDVYPDPDLFRVPDLGAPAAGVWVVRT